MRQNPNFPEGCKNGAAAAPRPGNRALRPDIARAGFAALFDLSVAIAAGATAICFGEIWEVRTDSMQMNDQRDIRADRATVWAALLDPEVLAQCVPGTQSLTGSPEDGFEATVVQKVGPVKATFKGVVSLSDMVPLESLTLSGEGKGGAAGFAKGGANVRLEEIPEGTRLIYDVEAKVGGKLAQLGSRLIDGFAKKMADQFFSDFQSAIEGDSAVDDKAEDDATDDAEKGTKKGWVKRLIS